MGGWDDEGGDAWVGTSHTSFRKLLLGDQVENMGIKDEFPSEWAIELMVVRPIIGPGYLFDVSSGKFVGQDESMFQVLPMSCGAFFANEIGNFKKCR